MNFASNNEVQVNRFKARPCTIRWNRHHTINFYLMCTFLFFRTNGDLILKMWNPRRLRAECMRVFSSNHKMQLQKFSHLTIFFCTFRWTNTWWKCDGVPSYQNWRRGRKRKTNPILRMWPSKRISCEHSVIFFSHHIYSILDKFTQSFHILK